MTKGEQFIPLCYRSKRRIDDKWIQSINMRSIVHFTDIKAVILSHLKCASQEIKVAVAWLTDEDIIRSLAQKVENKVNVQIIISDAKENFHNTSKFKDFIKFGGELYVATPKFFHHKFCIIDGKIILNGSFNWTYVASRNEENIIAISLDNSLSDDSRLLKAFQEKYKHYCGKACKKITDIADLNEFKVDAKDVALLLSKVDEEEVILRQDLEEDVKKSFETTRTLKIGLSDYLLERMKIDGGGVEFIKRILYDEMSTGEMKSGFRRLEERIPNRVDLSLEYIASRPKYQRLFTDKEVSFCRNLMRKYNLLSPDTL